ncbi:MAG: ribosomal RNA small subunit methyltransferase A [Spirochaetaceae bacterium]|nr:ribosomal RNA small subunit methyltransferase A [Spirochaetaceae bacterium]
MSWKFPYDSPNAIIQLLEDKGLAMSKKFGQNFLLSPDVRKRIVAIMELKKDTNVWEIGPGLGAITLEILATGAQLTAFEIDHGFCRILEDEAFGDDENFRLIEGDALKKWKEVYEEEGVPNIICGNLPYNVGSICIAKLLENECHPSRMVFTLQKEVAQRISSPCGSKLWSSFSILAQIDYDTRIAMDINTGAFFPVPNVTSSVILMKKLDKSLVDSSIRATFLMVVRDSFGQRRKTLRNNLLGGKSGKLLGREATLRAIATSGLEEGQRGEKIDIPSFIKLATAIQDEIQRIEK